MKTFITCCIALLLLLSCKEQTQKPLKNDVLILGTIHSGHLTDSVYNLPYLRKLVKEINPDFILAEIPPDRFQAAVEGFKRDDSISEPRVMRFPEYVDVIFPLTKEMDFEIIPTAGWTKPMADERSAKLHAISQDSTRTADWDAYYEANNRSDSVYKATGKVNDPHFIHTDTYDSIQDISLQVYNKLFNVELGLGGWDNINIAHYWNIEKALEKHRYSGKRFLITYGAGHKSWFIRELRKRDDIDLIKMEPFLKAIEKE
nr:hypothetical protein [uncultured Allomuricauda sp.]